MEKLLDDTTNVIQLDFAEDASNLTDEQKANINNNDLENFFSNKARIKEGAKHVAALDKNRSSTKRYKKYFGWGLP